MSYNRSKTASKETEKDGETCRDLFYLALYRGQFQFAIHLNEFRGKQKLPCTLLLNSLYLF